MSLQIDASRLQIPAVVRNTSAEILKAYLVGEGWLSGEDFDDLASLDKRPYRKQLAELLTGRVQRMTSHVMDFVLIDDFGSGQIPCEELCRWLMVQHNPGESPFSLAENPYDLATVCLMRWRESVKLFRRMQLHRLVSRKRMLSRVDYFRADAVPLRPEPLKTFETAVLGYLNGAKGASETHRFEHHVFEGKDYLLFLASDAPEILEVMDHGEEETSIIRLKLDISIVIDPKHQEVSVVARDKKVCQAVHREAARAFCAIEDLVDYPERDSVFDTRKMYYDLLRNRGLALEIPEGCCVEAITVNRLYLSELVPPYGRFMLDGNHKFASRFHPKEDPLLSIARRFLRIDDSSRNATHYTEVTPSRIELTAHCRPSGDLTEQTFYLDSWGESNLRLDPISEAIRACLRVSGYLIEGGKGYTESKDFLRDLFADLAAAPQGVLRFSAARLQSLPPENRAALVDQDWIAHRPKSRFAVCTACDHVQDCAPDSPLRCEHCGTVTQVPVRMAYETDFTRVARVIAECVDAGHRWKEVLQNTLTHVGEDPHGRQLFVMRGSPCEETNRRAYEQMQAYQGNRLCLHLAPQIVPTGDKVRFLPVMEVLEENRAGKIAVMLPKELTFGERQRRSREKGIAIQKSDRDWIVSTAADKLSREPGIREEDLARWVAKEAVKKGKWSKNAKHKAKAEKDLSAKILEDAWLAGLTFMRDASF